MIRKVGFTGTAKGMTDRQKDQLRTELVLIRVPGIYQEFHHGDCVGADAQAHEIAYHLGFSIIIHPPNRSYKRAYCQNWDRLEIQKPYLERNKDIAREAQALIACPKESNMVLRSGTWATVRYARKYGRKVVILDP